jgi:hypothetical protein
VRGRLTLQHDVISEEPLQWRSVMTLVIHPGQEELVKCLWDNVMVRPDEVERINLQEAPQGGFLTVITDHNTIPGGYGIPNGINWHRSEVRLWPTKKPLNEFGYLYVGLYIAGNYARYYPDKWLSDVERNSPLALGVEELVYIAEQRMALLSYGEFAGSYQVLDD